MAYAYPHAYPSKSSLDMKISKNRFVGSLKDADFFRHGIRMLPEIWEKVVASDGQYFEYIQKTLYSFIKIISTIFAKKQ